MLLPPPRPALPAARGVYAAAHAAGPGGHAVQHVLVAQLHSLHRLPAGHLCHVSLEWWVVGGVGSTDLAAGATVRIRLSEIAGSDLVPHSTLSLNPCPTPGANFYFEIFAHRYVSQVGLGPRAAKPTPSGSQEPSRQQQHPQRQDSGAATVSTASLRHKAE